MADYADRFELILVDDGSSDGTWELVREAAAHPRVRGIRLRRNAGQTAAMMAGFDHARGDVVVSLDGDMQNDPRDIPRLVGKLDEGYDLVCGWRENRQDRWLLRKVPSWMANRLIRWVTGVAIRDTGCSLKAYRRPLLDRLTLYADQHRFIPGLAARSGARITEIPVRHHARKYGESKYGLSRAVKVAADLLALKMVTTFGVRPLSGLGFAVFVSLALALVFSLMWIIAVVAFRPEKASALVFPGAALLWVGAALYMAMLGLIAEVAVRSHQDTAGRPPAAREM